MKLNKIFKNAPEIEIEQLSCDSRLPMKNAIFFCLDGIKYNGHNFINEAIKNGAKVIVYSKELNKKLNAIYIKVNDVNQTLIKIADIFYNKPNEGINEYLITGCYGKSSTSFIMRYYLNKVSNCGSVGAFGINYNDKHLSTPSITMTTLENIKVLDTFKRNDIKNAIFETNSISLFYKKMDVLKPKTLIYTNTSRYCSDYKVCNNYYFDNICNYLYTLDNKTKVLLNYDDESFDEFSKMIDNFYSYGTNQNCDYYIHDAINTENDTKFIITNNGKDYNVYSKLLGFNNVYNLGCAIAALNLNGYDIQDIIEKIRDIPYVEGVMHKIDNDYNVIVDSGYEIDSLQSILEFASSVTKGKLICVFAINYSDSDYKVKNVVRLCEKYTNKTILTEDESAEDEVMNILSRCDKYIKTNKFAYISFRTLAIENAISIMNKDDTLLILGKGNEKYLYMSLGKERYLGDIYYALKYIKKRKEDVNEII